MSVVLVANPKAGRGRAQRLFERFRGHLQREGFPVLPLALGDPGFADAERFEPARFRGSSVLVAFGGDGTLNAIAEPAAATGTPVYHVPAGNENLFARSFGMTTSSARFINALRTRRVIHTDTALCNGRGFLIMVGFGPDAGVIRSLHALRTQALGHLAYAEPIARECITPTIQPLTVEVDGKRIAEARRGWLVVANNPEYASRINFASGASPTDGLLDAAFMPAENLRDCINWMLRAWTRQHRRDPRLLQAQGAQIRVISENGPVVYQLDGECPHAEGEIREVRLGVAAGRLPVLLP